MEDSIDTNFLYLTISIIILIVIYNVLLNTKEEIYDKKIILETKKKIYEVPYDICDIYLTNIRKNLKLLYSNSNNSARDSERDSARDSERDSARDSTESINSQKTCNNLRAFIDQTHEDLQSYIQNNMKSDELDLLRFDVINKYGLFKNSLEISHENSSDAAFINILIDIEMILYMIRNSLCKDKKLVLISLHNLMEELYTNRCQTNNTYDNFVASANGIEKFAGDWEELYDITGLDIVTSNVNAFTPYGTASGPSINSRLSQNIEINVLDDEEYGNEKESLIYKEPRGNLKEKNKTDKKKLVSQEFNCSADYILTSKNTQPYVPFCDVNKLRNERLKIKAMTTDLKCNRSLRNDYDYLDI